MIIAVWVIAQAKAASFVVVAALVAFAAVLWSPNHRAWATWGGASLRCTFISRAERRRRREDRSVESYCVPPGSVKRGRRATLSGQHAEKGT
jgi:hypothetical protein